MNSLGMDHQGRKMGNLPSAKAPATVEAAYLEVTFYWFHRKFGWSPDQHRRHLESDRVPPQQVPLASYSDHLATAWSFQGVCRCFQTADDDLLGLSSHMTHKHCDRSFSFIEKVTNGQVLTFGLMGRALLSSTNCFPFSFTTKAHSGDSLRRTVVFQ